MYSMAKMDKLRAKPTFGCQVNFGWVYVLFTLPIAVESVIELSKILGAGVLVISHQSQCWCTSPASRLHECGLLSLYIVFGNIRGFSLYIPTSRPRLNPTCMATREPVQRP